MQVGAIIVCPTTKTVLGKGFNRMPPGCEHFPWGEVGNILDTKFPYGEIMYTTNRWKIWWGIKFSSLW